MSRTINKKAYLRSDDTDKCPFGIPIADGCRNAGECVDRLCPLEEVKDDAQKEELAKLNRKVFFYGQEKKPCKYAENILKDKEMVNCNFGDTAEGKPAPTFIGSPFYPKLQSGEFAGLYVSPVSFFVTMDIMYRNYPFGLYSYYGSLTDFVFLNHDRIVKIADVFDENGNSEKSDLIDHVLNDIATGKPISLDKAKEFVELCREDFNSRRITPEEQNINLDNPRISTCDD